MATTYPIPVADGTLTAAETQRLLTNNPTIIARRIANMANQRFIADYLLQGRFNAEGGAVYYETGDPVFAATRDPESISPGGEYPLTPVDAGALAVAKTKKWGEDTEIFDESIKRNGNKPLDRGLMAIVNKLVKWIDAIGMSAINTAVTQTFDVAAAGNGGAWTSGQNIVTSLLLAKAYADALGDAGYDHNTAVLTPIQHAKVVGYFMAAQIAYGNQPNASVVDALGFSWVTSPQVTAPMLVDRTSLGGMADEQLGGPGYAKVNNMAIEAKTMRLDKVDGWRVRARRVTVPVVTDPLAGIKLINTGI